MSGYLGPEVRDEVAWCTGTGVEIKGRQFLAKSFCHTVEAALITKWIASLGKLCLFRVVFFVVSSVIPRFCAVGSSFVEFLPSRQLSGGTHLSPALVQSWATTGKVKLALEGYRLSLRVDSIHRMRLTVCGGECIRLWAALYLRPYKPVTAEKWKLKNIHGAEKMTLFGRQA